MNPPEDRSYKVALVIVIAVLIIGIVGLLAYFYHVGGTPNGTVDATKLATANRPDPDVTSFSDPGIPDSDNGAILLNTVSTTSISVDDRNFLSKYFGNYSATTSAPLAQTTSIVKKYSKELTVFDQAAKMDYRCDVERKEVCNLQTTLNLTRLAVARTYLLLQQKQYASADTSSQSLIAVGKSLTRHSIDGITFLIGWLSQKNGYILLGQARAHEKNVGTSDADKASLIATLRAEEKHQLQFQYIFNLTAIELAENPRAQIPYIADVDRPEVIQEFTTFNNQIKQTPSLWNPDETRLYYNQSYKIAVSNVDRGCNAAIIDSKTTTGFDPNEPTQENFIGKLLYEQTYANIDQGFTSKRCEVESAINSLP